MKTVCICGAGTMGSGIAQVAAQAGFPTIQFDISESMIEKSRSTIVNSLQKLIEKGKINEAKKTAVINRIHFTCNISECIADLIIEAIVENKDAKAELFNKLAAINKTETIFATNTSSLSVTEIADKIKNPERVAGMHFFNPAPVMKLIEVVRAQQTDNNTINEIVSVAKAMGKIPVVCKDASGFIVNRVARQYYLEAMRLAEDGIIDFKTIDALMESAGFKMGPFKLMDLIGLDVNYSVSNIVWEALGKPERLQPSSIQKAKVDAGELGRKTGKGFYEY